MGASLQYHTVVIRQLHGNDSKNILKNICQYPDGVYLCIAEDPWQHHFEKDNYVPVNSLTAAELHNKIANGSFIKLAMQYPLSQWDAMPELLLNGFEKLIRLMDA